MAISSAIGGGQAISKAEQEEKDGRSKEADQEEKNQEKEDDDLDDAHGYYDDDDFEDYDTDFETDEETADSSSEWRHDCQLLPSIDENPTDGRSAGDESGGGGEGIPGAGSHAGYEASWARLSAGGGGGYRKKILGACVVDSLSVAARAALRSVTAEALRQKEKDDPDHHQYQDQQRHDPTVAVVSRGGGGGGGGGKSRLRRILAVVKLEEVGGELFDLPPLSLHALYELGRGPALLRHVAATQTGDDADAASVQTEDISYGHVAVQCPDDLARSTAEEQAGAMAVDCRGVGDDEYEAEEEEEEMGEGEEEEVEEEEEEEEEGDGDGTEGGQSPSTVGWGDGERRRRKGGRRKRRRRRRRKGYGRENDVEDEEHDTVMSLKEEGRQIAILERERDYKSRLKVFLEKVELTWSTMLTKDKRKEGGEGAAGRRRPPPSLLTTSGRGINDKQREMEVSSCLNCTACVDLWWEPLLLGRRLMTVTLLDTRWCQVACAYSPPEKGVEEGSPPPPPPPPPPHTSPPFPPPPPPSLPSQPQSLSNQGCILMWDLWAVGAPQRVLICHGTPTCCLFVDCVEIETDNRRREVLIAGTCRGTLCLWDLSSDPKADTIAGGGVMMFDPELKIACERPTYITDADTEGNHVGPVLSVRLIRSGNQDDRSTGSQGDVALGGGGGGGGGGLISRGQIRQPGSSRLASLDGSGVVHIWMLVGIPRGYHDVAVGVGDADMGLRIGGKVRITHSASLNLAEWMRPTPPAVLHQARRGQQHHLSQVKKQGEGKDAEEEEEEEERQNRRTTCLAVLQASTGTDFLLGDDRGRCWRINSMKTHGTKRISSLAPRYYAEPDPDRTGANVVTSMSLSSHSDQLLAVGYGNGQCAVFSVDSSAPLIAWENACVGPVIAVRWSPVKPSTLFVVDGALSVLHVWDLMAADLSSPVASVSLTRVAGQADAAAADVQCTLNNKGVQTGGKEDNRKGKGGRFDLSGRPEPAAAAAAAARVFSFYVSSPRRRHHAAEHNVTHEDRYGEYGGDEHDHEGGEGRADGGDRDVGGRHQKGGGRIGREFHGASPASLAASDPSGGDGGKDSQSHRLAQCGRSDLAGNRQTDEEEDSWAGRLAAVGYFDGHVSVHLLSNPPTPLTTPPVQVSSDLTLKQALRMRRTVQSGTH
ncbi:hypothetical protein CBR_g12776 [Chara braunii]|uniref:WD repeat-containing protein 60 n=1 Tax=Chara braunii TaxID=69332 RepID=A0A388KSP0_CHABU|nr:hypothetical protein CBR_g12776 [Chara braunii]|eukprot:GBG73059.1 hypothetical protein CBR_g12776 [Chara braunii]